MKKKAFIFFLFFIFSTFANAAVDPYCDGKINQNSLDINNSKIKNIIVNVDNYRNWTRNSINILTGNFRWIPKKFKRRFDANIIVKFENNLICNFKARIRHNGDQKDHIALKENSITQSIDVHLKTGNIYGITKFKLLRLNTRGNFKDEIFLTELLRELNYLAPRTYYVNTKINDLDAKMILQEKATKELLEFNLRREGPIFEGDERFFFRPSKNLPANQLSNKAIGMLPLLEQGANAMLAKQTNANWINKGENHSSISFDALSNLNLAYLLYSNKYKDEKNNFEYSNYTLDNNILALNNPINLAKLDIYNLIIFSTNSWHGLVPNNRKFYWNSIENYFEPINYDSNADIKTGTSVFHLPVSEYTISAFDDLRKLLDNINIEKFTNKINLTGLETEEISVEKKINIIKNNLSELKNIYLNIDPEILNNNKNTKVEKKMWNKYYDSLHKVDPSVYLVKHSLNSNLFKICENKTQICIDAEFNKEQLISLLEGELVKDSKELQYLGKNDGSESLLVASKYKKIKLFESNFYFDENINLEHNEDKREINIFQLKPEARAFFYQGSLKNVKINFYGYKGKKKDLMENFPIDQRGLTGCLTFISLDVEDISIESDNSNCEDSVNLINIKGEIDEIKINNSFSDGLDIDFSKVNINLINISSSKNDCVDFSFGNYKINKMDLTKCGDKALSVGENSSLFANEIFAKDSTIGVASKDSSVVNLNSIYFKNLNTCLAAYNKKQEFNGSLIIVNNLKCENYHKKMEIDNYSEIIEKNNEL